MGSGSMFAGNSPRSLAVCGTPIGRAPSGTVVANGDLTLGTALNQIYSGGLWLYFPPGAAYAGSTAGFYWVVMSSITRGTIYNNSYVPGVDSWDVVGNPVGIVAAGPGAYTGVVVDLVGIKAKVPGGIMGNHGILTIFVTEVNNSSANSKGLSFYVGSNYWGGNGNMTTNISFIGTPFIQNRGVPNLQIARSSVNPGSFATDFNYFAINTSQEFFVQVNLVSTSSLASDWVILTGFGLEVTA